jgi:hypothetical protein
VIRPFLPSCRRKPKVGKEFSLASFSLNDHTNKELIYWPATAKVIGPTRVEQNESFNPLEEFEEIALEVILFIIALIVARFMFRNVKRRRLI